MHKTTYLTSSFIEPVPMNKTNDETNCTLIEGKNEAHRAIRCCWLAKPLVCFAC